MVKVYKLDGKKLHEEAIISINRQNENLWIRVILLFKILLSVLPVQVVSAI